MGNAINTVDKSQDGRRKLLSNEKLELKKSLENGNDENAIRIINIMRDVNQNISNNNEKVFSPLIKACQFDRKEVILYLVKLGCDLNSRDEIGQTALMNACLRQNKSMIEFLLNVGASLDVVDNYDQSALLLVCAQNQIELASLLLASGGSQVQCAIVKCGGRCLLRTASRGHEAISIFLIEKGVDVDFVCETTGNTTLHFACQNNCLALVKMLLEYGADDSIKNFEGKIALDLAWSYNTKEFLRHFQSTRFVLK